jgi:hypothetical protein
VSAWLNDVPRINRSVTLFLSPLKINEALIFTRQPESNSRVPPRASLITFDPQVTKAGRPCPTARSEPK